MNRFSINGGALNSGGSLASIVYLPEATATVERELSERIAIKLSGTTVSNWYGSGDISRLFILGATPFAFNLSTSGSLTRNLRIYLDAVSTSFDLSGTGSLSIRKHFASSSVAMAIAVSGKLDPRNFLKGGVSLQRVASARLHSKIQLNATSINISITSTGVLKLRGGLKGLAIVGHVLSGNLALGKRIQLPPAAWSFAVANTGTMRGNFRMQGRTEKLVVSTAALRRTAFLHADNTLHMTTVADLANNAGIKDIEAFLMIRKETKREMTR